jgi:hypothetical protein
MYIIRQKNVNESALLERQTVIGGRIEGRIEGRKPQQVSAFDAVFFTGGFGTMVSPMRI